MGTITVSVDDEVEKEFRKIIEERGKKKGDLGKAITEAMKKWLEEKKQKEIAERELEILKKGYKMGKVLYKKREELYEERLRKQVPHR